MMSGERLDRWASCLKISIFIQANRYFSYSIKYRKKTIYIGMHRGFIFYANMKTFRLYLQR